MGKLIIEIIGNTIEITGNPEIDSVLVSIIGVLSFLIAFGWVGKIFDFIGFYDSDVMSGVHWSIRIVIFLGLSYIMTKVVEFVTWFFSFSWWVYLITVICLISVIVIVHVLKYRIQKKKNSQKNLDTEKDKSLDEVAEVVVVAPEPVKIYNKFACPRCNAKLVKRHGPYGDFYGCESYGKTGCRYTRKYL